MSESTETTAHGAPRERRLSLVVARPEPGGPSQTKPVKLMIVDRDRALTGAVSAGASRRGWESHVLRKPVTRRTLARMKVDVLLVDPAIMDGDRWSWLEGVVSGLPGLAVVVCAGPSTVTERVRALRFGVDDWLDKPAHPDEVIARVARAAQRRRQTELSLDASAVLAGEIEIVASARQVRAAALSEQLTQREFDVLRVLAARQGRVVAREEIFSLVWGYTMVPGDRSVDVHVRKIRSKLARVSPTWTYIHTQFRIGYRFQPERG